MKTNTEFPQFYKCVSMFTGSTLVEYMVVSDNKFIVIYPNVNEISTHDISFEVSKDHIESNEKAFKDAYQKSLNELTLQYHNLFTPTKNEFIHEQQLKHDGY